MKKKKRKLTRSENMSRIRSKDTKPEILLRKALWAKGFRYRLHSDLPGRPDLVFPRFRLAVFMDGCFWHGCPQHYAAPKTRADFWKNKLRRNVLRDMEVEDQLADMGWKSLRFWEHDLKYMEKIVEKISGYMKENSSSTVYRFAEKSGGATIAETLSPYGSKEWRICTCGSPDVRLLAVSGPGSLRPDADRKPESAELICRKCRNIFQADIF